MVVNISQLVDQIWLHIVQLFLILPLHGCFLFRKLCHFCLCFLHRLLISLAIPLCIALLFQRTSRICLALRLCICDDLLCLCICLCYDLLCAAVCLLDQPRCIFIQRAFYQLRIRLYVRLCCSRLIIFRFIHVCLFFLHDLIRIRRHFPKGFQPLGNSVIGIDHTDSIRIQLHKSRFK